MSVTFQVLLGFDEVSSFAAHAAQTGAGIRIKGPIPPSGGSPGVGDALCVADGWTLVAGLMGSGKAVQGPDQLGFTFNSVGGSAALYDTLLFGFRFKVSTLASVQEIGRLRVNSGGYAFEIDTAGKLRVKNLATSGLTITSTGASLTTGTVYHLEAAVYLHATLGVLQVNVNGVTDGTLVATAGNTQAGGTALGGGVLFSNANLTIDDVYVYAGDGGFAAEDFIGSATRLPRLSALFPAAAGFHNDWIKCGTVGNDPEDMIAGEQDDFCAITGAGSSSNYTFVAETPADKKMSYLQCQVTGGLAKDSWVMAALDASAGEIVAVQSQLLTWSEFDDERHDSHFLRRGGSDHNHPDDLSFEWIGLSPFHGTMAWSSRWWPNDPAVRGWLAADFIAGVEFGTENLSAASKMGVSQALIYVLWLEPLPITITPPEDVGAECAPCDEASAAQYLDSFLPYDGVNTTAGTVMLVLSPGADWTTPGLTHTLDSAALFLSTDFSPAPAKAFRLGDPDGDTVIVDVTGFTNTSTLTVTNRTPVPVSLQAVATTTWARMVKKVTGLGHLEAEVVYALLDGIPAGPFTVAAGVVTFAVHAAVAVVGLKYQADYETLDFDIPNQGRPISMRQKLTGDVMVFLKKSRQFQAGDPNNPTGMKPYTMLTTAQRAATPALLKTDKIVVKTEKKWENTGRIYIRSDDGLPLNILAVEPGVALGGNP